MFYSQTFLARKGPLGTVWCAAHLQHRLKKSHYTATDIPSTVDRIMCPEVPIALRMSGHLLLGVVRIYSKKVDYLFHDCNIILIGLRKVFALTQVNLPEDARQAPVQAITLPETFDLDAMEFDGDMSTDGALDNHLSSQEDITLTDQIPIGRDPYVAITFDEDIMMDASPPEVFLTSSNPHGPPENSHVDLQDPSPDNQIEVPRASAAFQDTGPSNQTLIHDAAGDCESPGPSNQTQLLKSIINDSSQSIELRRDAPCDFSPENPFPVRSDLRNDATKVTGSLNQVLNEKEIYTPSSNMLPSGLPSVPFRQHSDPPISAASKGSPEDSFVYASPQLVIQPSPPVHQPRKRRIPRQRFFDEKLVLPNRLMKRALEDCSDLVRKRRKIPCSALGVWKLDNSRIKEQVFNEPSLTGLCASICNMLKREYISTKPHLAVPKEVVPEPTVPQSTTPTTEAYQEIERLRNNESNATDNVLPQLSSPVRSMPSLQRSDDSPLSINSLESELGPKAGFSAIPEFDGSEIDTPGFSAIPGFESSEADLNFLEEDGKTPTESLASKGVDSLSQRTRQLAKYLKRQSPITPLSEDHHGDLSLNKILEGKTRKICARMFFETLVLKSHELVDVRQEQPYGDITLKLTPTLSKAQI